MIRTIRSAIAGVACLARGRRLALRERGDDGNLVLVLVLVLALVLAATTTIAVLIPGFTTAQTSQTGEQAVAQADAGLSDALFRLDQAGDGAASFCVGKVAASALPSDLTAASCLSPSSTQPLVDAPGLQYYVVDSVAPPLPFGVTSEFAVTSYAIVHGEGRTVTAAIYRIADNFGFFGVSGFDANGALKQASVFEVGGYPGSQPLAQGTVAFGVGPNGNATCTGNSGGSQVITIGQIGAQVDPSCPNAAVETSGFVAQTPAVCASGQIPTAFAPCVNTSTFATSNNAVYCPLPGVGIPNSLNTSLPVTPPAPNAVFDCRTSGTTVTIGTSSVGNGSVKYTLPFQLTSIPPGTYYFDSNNVTLANLDPAVLAGPASIFVLPATCAANNCPTYRPTTAATNKVSGRSGCNLPPSSNSDANLSISGTYINATSAAENPFPFTPGNVGNLNVYWSGNDAITTTGGAVFDGALYAPGAIEVIHGKSDAPYIFGSMVLNCFTQKGAPQMYLAYAQHATQYLQSWTVTNYRITA
jgi:hypothetical protein